MKVGSLVLVEWVDARNLASGWHDEGAVRGYRPSRCRSVGWVVAADGDFVTLAATTVENQDAGDRNPEVGQCVVIPRKCVTDVRGLPDWQIVRKAKAAPKRRAGKGKP